MAHINLHLKLQGQAIFSSPSSGEVKCYGDGCGKALHLKCLGFGNLEFDVSGRV